MSLNEKQTPGVFDPDAIDAETLAFNDKLEKLLSAQPPQYTKTPQQVRAERESGKSWMGPIRRHTDGRNREVTANNHSVAVRVFSPDQPRGVFLHMHGGGFVTGRPDHFDDLLFASARATNLTMVSVDYRLAPENPYPAAADDCEAAAVWLVENAANEFGADRLYIGGESAGANLAVVTLLRMRDRHGFDGFEKANLVFGCFDISMTPSQRNWGERNLLISTPTIEWYNNHYVPDPHQRRDPEVSPLYAQLGNLPEALFTVGTMDPLLDDTLFMHARWLAAGNRAQLAVYPGGAHAFTAFPISIAKTANRRMYDFLCGS
jgi:acetyl esterase/lipase